MKNHKPIAFILTISIYTIFFAAWIYSAAIKPISDKKQTTQKVTMVQMQIIRPPAPKPTPKPEPVIEIPKEIIKPIEKIVKVEPKPLPKKPKIKKKVVKEPIKQAKATPTPPPPAPKQVTQTVIAPKKPQTPKVNIEAERNIFLASLKKTINQNKHYPKSAVRRHIQGTVDASFCINRHGKLKHVDCKGAPMMLIKAAKESIQKSFPVNVPHNIQSQFPMDVTLQIEFKLG